MGPGSMPHVQFPLDRVFPCAVQGLRGKERSGEGRRVGRSWDYGGKVPKAAGCMVLPFWLGSQDSLQRENVQVKLQKLKDWILGGGGGWGGSPASGVLKGSNKRLGRAQTPPDPTACGPKSY